MSKADKKVVEEFLNRKHSKTVDKVYSEFRAKYVRGEPVLPSTLDALEQLE